MVGSPYDKQLPSLNDVLNLRGTSLETVRKQNKKSGRK